MTVAEEKIKIIKKLLETSDTLLLREIASLLHIPSLTDYTNQPVSQETLLAKMNTQKKLQEKAT
ncbi:hypothetical protein GO730_12660 [Spirosoma sp. HMF3257]|uniref:Uncharacterized protein n=1 Tax=Spirosoma telluris TaxID=2183553 RepID=A0A327NHZ0_9BACT|nr:hypothetical protein [Spirosoma telluris]RAI74862.1 hypothetical protein HMF3257_12570 [Spirosoma telluris]